MVPFKGESIKELHENILNKNIDFDNPRLALSDKMKYMLCNTWFRIKANTDVDTEQQAAFGRLH